MLYDRVKVQVSFVIELIDDFTNQVITSPTLQICGDGYYHPIRKSDGCYIFVNCPKQMKLSISSHCYQEKKLEIDSRGRIAPIIKVRLIPDRRYQLPEGTTCIKGRTIANSRIAVILEQEKNSWKLLYDYQQEKEGLEIQLFNPFGQDLEGRQFFITDKQRIHRDIFEIQRYDMKTQIGYLKQQLSSDYKKVGTKVYDVYVSDTDENGFYYLPIREKIQDTDICYFYIGDEIFERKLIPTKINQIDFL